MNKKSDKKKSLHEISEIHSHHNHQHGETCVQKAVHHGDQVDYVHDGRLHRIHGKNVSEFEESENEIESSPK